MLGLIWRVRCLSGEDRALDKCADRKGRDNGEVIASSAESKIEILIMSLGSGGNRTIGEDDLEITGLAMNGVLRML